LKDHAAMTRELTTAEVARVIDVPVDLLRKWKYRGLLKNAPHGISGQGRGIQCCWSEDAVAEAHAYARKQHSNNKTRRRSFGE
jgi:hypothetical protein